MELDFSKMEAVTEEDSSIDFGTMQQAGTEDNPEDKVDDAPKPKTKQDLINEEFDIRKKSILEKKDMLDTNRELLLNKNEQERIDKLYDADTRDKDIKAKEEGVTAPSRLNVGLGEFQGQMRVNVLAPIAEAVGMEDSAKEMREKGEVQIETGKSVEKKFKDIYGDDAWNVAQSIGNLTPEIANAVLSIGKNTFQATVGAGLEYSRTGSALEAGKTGIVDLFGGALADRIFKLGKLSKFGEDINKLPPDKRDFANEAITAMENAGIDKLDEQARKEILGKIDFSKPSSEVSENLVKEISDLKDKALGGVNAAYDLANEAVDKSVKKKISSFEKSDPLFDGMIFGKDEKSAIKDINKYILQQSRSGNLDATEIEAITRSLSGYSGGGKEIAKRITKRLREEQEDMLPDGKKNVYNTARKLFKDYGTRFTSRIQGEGGEVGKSVEDIITTNQAYEVASDILTSGMNPNRAKALKDIGLSESSRVDAVKDVLIKGLDEKNLAENDGISTIVNRYKSSNKNAVRELLGDGYKKFDSNMKALEMINNTLKDSPVDEGIKQNVINFVTNASMVKVSPLYGYKGMAYEGREIASKVAFRKSGTELKSRVNKFVKSKTVANKIIKAINMTMASSAGNFNGRDGKYKEDTPYPKNLIGGK